MRRSSPTTALGIYLGFVLAAFALLGMAWLACHLLLGPGNPGYWP
jgi:hypothetical protein